MSFSKIFKQAIFSIRPLSRLKYHDAIILMYHRVAELDSDPWSLAVRPKHFDEHMDIIQKHGYPMSLTKFAENLNDNHPLQRAIVVTFDDGYKDNLNNAKPILEKYNIPATVFVTTGCIEQQRDFWWDELDRLLLQPRSLPDLLQLNIRGKRYQWKTVGSEHYSSGTLRPTAFQSIKSKIEELLNRRLNLYRKIYKILQLLSPFEREQVLKELKIWVNTESTNWKNQLPLTKNDLITLGKEGLIEIGAHTESHPHLSKIPLNKQRDEILKSKAYLENILGHNVNSFAYPHGSYIKDTVSLVKEAGFSCACSSIFGKVKRRNNLYLLPRVVIKDWDGETFYRYFSKIAW